MPIIVRSACYRLLPAITMPTRTPTPNRTRLDTPEIRQILLARRLLSALVAGVLTTLSFSPIGFWPAGLVGIAGLFLAISGLDGRRAAWVGWVFGLGLFGTGTSWVWVSIATYGNVG